MSTFRTSAGLSQSGFTWRDLLAKSALLFFGIALWHKGLSFYGYYLLISAWILDGGLRRFGETVKEPVVFAMLVLCGVLALGILWSDDPKLGFKVWNRYFAYLIFIPYLSLLNKARLPWAIGGLLVGVLFGNIAYGVAAGVLLAPALWFAFAGPRKGRTQAQQASGDERVERVQRALHRQFRDRARHVRRRRAASKPRRGAPRSAGDGSTNLQWSSGDESASRCSSVPTRWTSLCPLIAKRASPVVSSPRSTGVPYPRSGLPAWAPGG